MLLKRMAAILAAAAPLCPAAWAHEWPAGPNKHYLENLQRPDNAKSPERWTDPKSLMCCGVADTVKTRIQDRTGRWTASGRPLVCLAQRRMGLGPTGENRPGFCARRTALSLSARRNHSVLRAAQRRAVMMRAALVIAALSALAAPPSCCRRRMAGRSQQAMVQRFAAARQLQIPGPRLGLHDVLRSR